MIMLCSSLFTLTLLCIVFFLITILCFRRKEKELFSENDNDLHKEHKTFGCDGAKAINICKLQTRVLDDLIRFDPTKEIDHLQSHALLAGNYHQQDVSYLTDLRSKMIQNGMDIIMNTHDFILFFEKPDFQGHLYYIPCSTVTWKTDTMTNAQKYHDQTNTLLYNEVQNVTDNVSTSNDIKTVLSIGQFIREFNFYFHRTFSCVLPPGTEIKIIPFDRENIEEEPFILTEGKHKQKEYNLPAIREFHITCPS